MALRVEVLSLERRLLDEPDVQMLIAPGADGVIGILPQHTPLMSALAPGELEVRIAGRAPQFIALGGGFIEVQPDHVVVLADAAEHAEEIDLERAEAARRRAEERVEQTRAAGGQDYEAAMGALNYSTARLRVGQRRRHGVPVERVDT